MFGQVDCPLEYLFLLVDLSAKAAIVCIALIYCFVELFQFGATAVA